MSDLDVSDETPAQPEAEESPVIRSLRKDREDARAEADAAKQELALHKAGLGALTDKQIKALTAAHDGDWESEALKATATEIGIVREPGEAAAPSVPAEELEAHQRVADAAGGAPPSPTDVEAALLAATSTEERHEILRNAGMLYEA